MVVIMRLCQSTIAYRETLSFYFLVHSYGSRRLYLNDAAESVIFHFSMKPASYVVKGVKITRVEVDLKWPNVCVSLSDKID